MNLKRISLLGAIALTTVLASCQGLAQSGAPRLEADEVQTPTASGDTSFERPDYTDPEAYDQVAVKALNALQNHDNAAEVHYLVTVEFQDDPSSLYTTVDTFIQQDVTYSYHYGADGERATATGGVSNFGDWNDATDEPIPGRYTTSVVPTTVYWRDPDTGLTTVENRTYDNQVQTLISATVDDITGTVTPVVFDTEHINPWDFIDYEDLTRDEEEPHTYHLALNKAELFTRVYDATGMNTITDAVATLDDQGRIASLNFLSDPLRGDASNATFTRSNVFSIEYSYADQSALFTHKTPYQADQNPEIATVFDALDQALTNGESYRYDKGMKGYSLLEGTEDTNTTNTGVTGFFTKDNIYFAQWGPNHDEYYTDGAFYNEGDNYDYGAVRQLDGTYLAYQCPTTGIDVSTGEPDVYWSTIAVSSTAYYTLDSYSVVGPTFNQLSPDIFIPAEEEGWYTVDDQLLGGIGTYFDFAFLGVHSTTLESTTESFRLRVDQDADGVNYTMTVEMSFTMLGFHSDVTTTFDTASIGHTDLPEYCYSGDKGAPFTK